MDNQADYSGWHENKLNQLEEENNSLREELKALRSTYQVTLLELKNQLAIEKKYQMSQQRFRTIFEQSKLGSKIIAPDLTIIQANKALQQMLGYSEKELEGTKITDYAHPDHKKHWKELQECLWTHKIPSFQIDTLLFKKDGSTIWCSINTILFPDYESTLGYTILEDITDRKASEESFQKQAAIVNADLENFIYTASHELKAPVVNIEGLMVTLTKKLTQKFSLDDEHNRMLSMVGASVDKLKSTIADLTEIAKVQKEEVEDEIVSINQLADEVYQV
jgi:two-component system sensor histidine kinase VicK